MLCCNVFNFVSYIFKMGRILAIDYGKKRCGIAVTDPLQMISNALDTIDTENIEEYLLTYCRNEQVEKIIFGLPFHSDGKETYLTQEVKDFSKILQQKLPEIKFDFQEESFTSVKAKEAILQSGTPKMKRRDKGLVDRISAVIILQEYLGHY